MTKVYLAGPVRSVDDGGHGWRDWVTSTFDQFEWMNPLDKYDSNANDVKVVESKDNVEEEGEVITRGELVKSDKNMIRRSDAMLVGWTKVPSVGTPMEVMLAYQQKMPIAVWLEPRGSMDLLEEREFSPWLKYHADVLTISGRGAMRTLEDLTDG